MLLGKIGMTKTFWNKKRVLITGDSGFKGGWLALWLLKKGAIINGISLKPHTTPSFYSALKLNDHYESNFIDINDFQKLEKKLSYLQPEIIFHLAAQSLVLKSYSDPIGTYKTNIIGTANLLEISRHLESVKVFINVTSDKCYENNDFKISFNENSRLGGKDPYSSSKACSEMLSYAYEQSFLGKCKLSLSTVRAGNVIGGGDWSDNRLIPDIVKSSQHNKILQIRYPRAIRPWQHVFDPLRGYIMLAEKMYKHPNIFKGAWNFGPNIKMKYTVQELINLIKKDYLPDLKVKLTKEKQYHESNYLSLSCKKAKKNLGWKPIIKFSDAVDLTMNWYENFYLNRKQIFQVSSNQIDSFERII